jgi:uncharacterized membrane protein YqjE
LPAENGKPDNIAATVTEVSERVTVLVREEIELAKAEMAEKVRGIRNALVAFGVAAVVGLFALVYVFLTIAWGLNSLLGSIWLGFLVVTGGMMLVVVGAVLFGWRKFRKTGSPTPTMAIEEAQKIRATVTTKSGAPV